MLYWIKLIQLNELNECDFSRRWQLLQLPHCVAGVDQWEMRAPPAPLLIGQRRERAESWEVTRSLGPDGGYITRRRRRRCSRSFIRHESWMFLSSGGGAVHRLCDVIDVRRRSATSSTPVTWSGWRQFDDDDGVGSAAQSLPIGTEFITCWFINYKWISLT